MRNFDLIRLTEAQWHDRESAHQLRADRLTADHMKRRRAGISHPVYDFLFEYYPVRVAHMKKMAPWCRCRTRRKSPTFTLEGLHHH